MRIITLTTDFGHSDPFVGIMKGVILGLAPDSRLVDLSHEIPPQDVIAGALALEAAVDYFPPGTIHVAVVDPGVGTERAAVAVECDGFVLVGPDNGLFGLVLERFTPIRAVNLTNSAFHLKPVSASFHGRDIFAPAAAHLACGAQLEEMGEPACDLVTLELPPLVQSGLQLEACVLVADGFGNVVTNLSRAAYLAWRGELSDEGIRVQGGPRTRIEIRRTYADVAPRQAVAFFGSSGRLEISVREGNAAKCLGLTRGSKVILHK